MLVVVEALRRGDMTAVRRLLQALTEPALPADPVELEAAVEDLDTARAGSWGEIRAARDYGHITDAEYDQLADLMEIS